MGNGEDDTLAPDFAPNTVFAILLSDSPDSLISTASFSAYDSKNRRGFSAYSFIAGSCSRRVR